MKNVADPSANPDDEIEVLLFETSPYGNLDAIVQQDRRTVFFYLVARDAPAGAAQFAPKACWVRNLKPGPYVINQDDFLAGRQVALPRTHVKSPAPGPLPRKEDLQIVWFEEGNGAALLEQAALLELGNEGETDESRTGSSSPAQVLAVIPPWSGREGFYGYAAECAMNSPICTPLPKNPLLHERIERAAEFWSSFGSKSDPFVELRDQWLAYLSTLIPVLKDSASLLTPTPAPVVSQQYYDISGGNFPPRGLMEYRMPDRIVLVTVGMSLCPQPNVELSTPEPHLWRRIELGIELPIESDSEQTQVGDSFDTSRISMARSELTRLASYPWRTFRWLGAGHTCQFPGVIEGFEKVQLIDHANYRKPEQQQTKNLASGRVPAFIPLTFRNDPVNLLWLIPVGG